MSRALEYLKRRLKVNDEEAKGILSSIRYLDKMDNGENMLCYRGLYLNVWIKQTGYYQIMIFCTIKITK